jgi:Na+/phosphate symporter
MLILMCVVMIVAGLLIVAFSEDHKGWGVIIFLFGCGALFLSFKAVEAAAIKAGAQYAFIDFITDGLRRLGSAS